MKLTKLLGAPALEVSRGRRAGVAERFFAREGYLGACGLMVRPGGWLEPPSMVREGQFRLMPDGVCLLEAGSSPSAAKYGDWYPLPLGVPVLYPDGEEVDQALDFELGPYGELLSVVGESSVYPAERVLCVGPDAVVTQKTEGQTQEPWTTPAFEPIEQVAPEAPEPAVQREEEGETPASPPPPEPPSGAGRELLGRIALRDIYDTRGEILLRKGRVVATEHIRQAYEQGLLVALATGTARNESN